MERIARRGVGKKMIVCGRAARWWDSEINDNSSLRQEVYKMDIAQNYKKVIGGIMGGIRSI